MLVLNKLKTLKNQFEKELGKTIGELGDRSKLRDAIEYSLISGGKRVRPLIVMMIQDALNKKHNVYPAAFAVEFFHTASLIADDLPCMDNDAMRRDKPSLHKIYDESVVILSSFTLISLGYEYIQKNTSEYAKIDCETADRRGMLALETVSKLAGIFGATNGQFLDLYPPDQSLETFKKIIYQKTITLFEIAFVLGWLFSGGNLDKMQKVKKLAYHLGMAFQVGDDLQDIHQDSGRPAEMNMVTFLGEEKAFMFYKHELEQFRALLKELELDTPLFMTFVDYLEKKQLEGLFRSKC